MKMSELKIIKDDIVLDFYSSGTEVVYAKQGDTGRVLKIALREAGKEYQIPAGVTARIACGTFWNECTIQDNKVLAPLSSDMLHSGRRPCQIELMMGDARVSTANFILYTEASARDDNAIMGSNKYGVLDGFIDKAFNDAEQTGKDAEQTAADRKATGEDRGAVAADRRAVEKINNDFTLTAQQAVTDVNNAGQTQTQRVNEAGDTQVSRIQAEGTTQVKNVQTAAAEITADRTQIHTNRDNTAQLQRTTASAIIREAAGSFLTLEDAAEGKGYRKLDVQGMTVQDGVPEPEAEAPLKNVGVLNPKTGKYEVKVTSCKNYLLDMTGAKGGTAAGITTVVNPDGTLTSNGTGTGAPVAVWLLGKYTADITGDNVLMVLQAGKTYYISDVVLFMGTEYPAQYKFFVDPEKYPEGFKVTGVRHAQIDSGTVLTNKVYYPRVILGDKDTGWEPYKGRTATVTSDRPLTQWDKLTCRDGVWGCLYDIGKDTETWTPLTDQEQSAMNALCSYAGTTHIWTDDPLQPVISLEYTVDTETYIRETLGGLRLSINPNDMGLDINY